MKTIRNQKRKAKIASVFIAIIFIFSNPIYAKYNYKIVLDAFSLNRDNSEIVYQIEKSVQDNIYTNKDVILKVIANKEIEEVEGFLLDETRTILTKTVTENEEKNLILEDLSGNKKEVKYQINNIDKEPPQILGIEDGETYNQKMDVDYIDNIGIADIKVELYEGDLKILSLPDYYDTESLKGLYVLGDQIYIDVISRPKGTKKYKFYLNDELKAITEKSEYTYNGLSYATIYKIKVEALDENDEVIQSVSKEIKTKLFKELIAEKNGDNFKVKITGFAENVKIERVALWSKDYNTRIDTYPTISDDRSLNLSFNAYDIDGSKNSGYYYFHVVVADKNTNVQLETICMNIIFDTNYEKVDDDNINPNILELSGDYEITVTDLAGNKTKKYCIIKL